MGQPAFNFHNIVTASLAVSLTISLSFASVFSAYGQESPKDFPGFEQALPGQGDGASREVQDGFSDLLQGDDAPGAATGPDLAESPSGAQESAAPPDQDMDTLFAELAQPDGEGWRRAQSDIQRNWSRSGSAAMDLLYKRGEAALDEGDLTSAIGHLTALTDHAPDFASGWHLRAVALYLDGEFGPSIADLGRVLELEPRHFPALTQMGVMLEEVGRDDLAMQAFRESLRINPHQKDAQDALRRLETKSAGTDA